MFKIKYIFFLFLLSNFIFSQTGKVIKVSDGDTITILTEEKEQIKIRLEGIDCPEKIQDYGSKARQFTNDLCYGKDVRIEIKGTDRYQRKLAIVWIDSININEKLIENGLAWHYKKHNNSVKYANLENKARKEKLNIWSQPNPIAPWYFRKKIKPENNPAS